MPINNQFLLGSIYLAQNAAFPRKINCPSTVKHTPNRNNTTTTINRRDKTMRHGGQGQITHNEQRIRGSAKSRRQIIVDKSASLARYTAKAHHHMQQVHTGTALSWSIKIVIKCTCHPCQVSFFNLCH